MKWALVALLTLGALGAWAMGLQAAQGMSSDVRPMPVPRVAMRALPELGHGVGAAAAKPEPVAAAAKPEPVAAAAKPEPVAAAKPEPVDDMPPLPKAEAKPEPVAVAPKAEPKPEPAKPEPAKPEPKPAPVREPKPEPVAKPAPPPREPKPAAEPKPAPEPKAEETNVAAPAAPAGGGEGSINLKASDTAEIVIDGRKVGPSPKLGVKLKAGKHKIRFDCYDENGNLKPGKVQTVDVRADEEHDVDYECPFAQ